MNQKEWHRYLNKQVAKYWLEGESISNISREFAITERFVREMIDKIPKARKAGRIKPKWSEHYNHCRWCKKTKYPHQHKGLCTFCYRKHQHEMKKEFHGGKTKPKGQWSIKFLYCQECKRTKYPYSAKGLCTSCYAKRKRLDIQTKVS